MSASATSPNSPPYVVEKGKPVITLVE